MILPSFRSATSSQRQDAYRIRRRSASSNKLKASADLWKVYRENEKLPFFKALYYFGCYAFNAIKKRL